VEFVRLCVCVRVYVYVCLCVCVCSRVYDEYQSQYVAQGVVTNVK
jgi:hypothetical protein